MPMPLARPFALFLAVLAAAMAPSAPARAQALPDAAVKAAYVYNFALFSEWPEELHADATSLHLCVHNASPGLPALAELQHKLVRGRRIHVRALAAGEAPRGCQLLYADGDRERWQQLRRDLPAGVLTVSDDTVHTHEGAMIALVRDGDRIAFHINAGAARQSRIQLSSKLLRLARTVQP